jgi:hypothetical protein
MKSMRYLFAVCVLASVLSMSAIAGTMHTGAPQPESTPPPADGGTSANGNMHTGNSDEATADGVLAEAALSLLQGVLALL